MKPGVLPTALGHYVQVTQYKDEHLVVMLDSRLKCVTVQGYPTQAKAKSRCTWFRKYHIKLAAERGLLKPKRKIK